MLIQNGMVSVEELLRQERANERSKMCAYTAPVFAVRVGDGGGWKLVQGNCHHWDCPRCGQEIARMNYGRMVEGLKTLPGPWYLLTLTARGAGYSVSDSERDWLLWSNRLFTRLREAAKKAGQEWHYVTVTERQKRGHPHSHTITTFNPVDGVLKQRYEYETISGRKTRVLQWRDAECTVPDMTIRSKWLSERVIAAGFGPVWDLSPVYNAEAAGKYVAKYLHKAQQHEKWPDRWKRVRYSMSWPKLEKDKTDAVPLLTVSEIAHFLAVRGASYDEKDATLSYKVGRAKDLYNDYVSKNDEVWGYK